MIKMFKKFEEWFDLKFGLFFTNGNKVEYRQKRLREKYNIKDEGSSSY